jgi:GT2 family glycosyltransferase
MPDLSVVIVNWNTRDLLRQCLGSLPAAAPGLATEVIVVDNGSRDGSAAMVREDFPSCRLLEPGRNLGFSAGNNLALKEAQGRHVLLLNPDTICRPGSLATLSACLEARADAAAVGPLLETADGEPTITWGRFPAVRYHLVAAIDPRGDLIPLRDNEWRFVHVPDRDEPSRPVDYVAGACLMLKASALARLGGLDERFFMYFEETDWCYRAWRQGWKVYYCAEARVAHLEGRAAEQASDFSRRQFYKSYRRFVTKNYGAGRVWQFRAAVWLEYSLKSLLRRIAPGDRERNRALARAWGRVAALQLLREIDATPPA